MFKINFHDNGKLQSLEISWKIIVALVGAMAAIISGFLSAITKAFIILAITIQGLFADPDSFIKHPSLKY